MATYFDIIFVLFCTLLTVMCCEHKVVQYFLVKCIQNFASVGQLVLFGSF